MQVTENLKKEAEKIAGHLNEFNAWRRGQGKYAWNEDPAKNVECPLSPEKLGRILDRTMDILRNL